MRISSGRVVSVLDDRTLKVSVTRYVRWPKVNKLVPRVRNFLVHTDSTGWRIGEEVRLIPIARVSKRKAHLARRVERC